MDEAVQIAHASIQTSEKLSFTVLSITNNENAVHFFIQDWETTLVGVVSCA